MPPSFADSYCFSLSLKGPHKGSTKTQSFAEGASQRLSLKSKLFSGPLAPLISPLSYHLSPNHPPGISCSFAAPVGLGSLNSCSSVASVGLNSFHL
ncbi:hypothetical protein TNCV_1373221 [Trichonephila clavipes]|uniref:Uncharacterized protein n=1 Tax=Trichonephila clavipes TaxID=2585209 RepID=A0A8X6WIU1_TRICX|nr:hypothetical protein TNCV_1373221 [Trichonephila clavipes]